MAACRSSGYVWLVPCISQGLSGSAPRPELPWYETFTLKTGAWLMGFRGGLAFAALVVRSSGIAGPICGSVVAWFLTGFLVGTGFAAPGLPDGGQAGEGARLAEMLA
jgi:hypothetical protein